MNKPDLSAHRPKSLSDPEWIERYIAKMGEIDFWKYKNMLYAFFDKLEVDHTASVRDWAQEENYDLFVKLACFYVSESNCCYSINKECTIIKHNFDAREMESTFALFELTRRQKNAAGNGGGTSGTKGGTKVIPTQEPAIQYQQG